MAAKIDRTHTGRRCFLALPAEPFQDRITQVIEILSAQTKGVKWVNSKQTHLTLHFFGFLNHEQIQTIQVLMGDLNPRPTPLCLRLDSLGFFPDARHLKVIWIGISGDTEKLHGLQSAVEALLNRHGFTPDTKPFRPHITVGRVKNSALFRMDKTIQTQIAKTLSGPSEMISKITLYESVTHASGPEYIPIETFQLS